MKLTIRPATLENWHALEDLFGKCGASNGCWCMYWRLGAAYRGRAERNKAALRELVATGPPPGLLAFDGELAVGWCQLTPRAALPYLERFRPLRRTDDSPVWAISCFFVRKGYRRRGVATALLRAAVKAARSANAPALEAYPSHPKKTKNVYTGPLSLFLGAGFTIVASRGGPRSIVRRAFRPQLSEGRGARAARGLVRRA